MDENGIIKEEDIQQMSILLAHISAMGGELIIKGPVNVATFALTDLDDLYAIMSYFAQLLEESKKDGMF